MPRRRRERRERTHEWQEIKQQTLWPEQEKYELLRPLLLFGETAASRAKETGVSERTLHYQADQFEQYGMVSLFPKERAPVPSTERSLPAEMRQLIVDLKSEHCHLSDKGSYTALVKQRALAEYTLSFVQCDNVGRDVSEQEGENPDEHQKYDHSHFRSQYCWADPGVLAQAL